MNSGVDRKRAQLFRLAYIVRNIAFYRALGEYQGALNQNFWIYTYNNFFDMSVLEWCKVFGSRGEPTHWSTVVSDVDRFRADLLAKLSLDQAAWEAYWEEVKNYRDLTIAHHTADPSITRYPSLDTALESTCFLYGRLIRDLEFGPEPVFFLPRDLSRYYQLLFEHAEQVSSAAYEASREIEDALK